MENITESKYQQYHKQSGDQGYSLQNLLHQPMIWLFICFIKWSLKEKILMCEVLRMNLLRMYPRLRKQAINSSMAPC